MEVVKRTLSLIDSQRFLVGKGVGMVVMDVGAKEEDTCLMSCRLQLSVRLTFRCSFRPEWTTTRMITCSDRSQSPSLEMKWMTNSCQIDLVFATEGISAQAVSKTVTMQWMMTIWKSMLRGSRLRATLTMGAWGAFSEGKVRHSSNMPMRTRISSSRGLNIQDLAKSRVILSN